MSAARVLYVAPAPGERGGIADYAKRFRVALDAAGVERHDLHYEVSPPTAGEVRHLRRRIAADVRGGRFASFALAHVELGAGSHREFHFARALGAHSALPLVLTLHEPTEVVVRPMQHLPGRLLPRLLEPVGTRQKRAVLGRANGLVTLGPAAAAQLRSTWGVSAPLFVVPHISFCGPRAQPSHGEPVRILHAGFFGRGKGLDVVLGAYASLLETQELTVSTQLVVAGAPFISTGRDPLGDLLKRHPIAQPHIQRVGFLDGAEFEELFASCHIGVVPYLPTVPGGASGILMRSLSAGLATLCSDSPALAQDVAHERTALVVRAGDEAALADGLKRLVNDADVRRRLGYAAAEIRTDRAPERIGTKIASVYDEVIHQPPASATDLR